MKTIEVKGTPRAIGHATGEALRPEIREMLALAPTPPADEWARRKPRFIAALERHLPRTLEEMRATAEGGDLEEDAILRLNLPLYAHRLDVGEGCSNVALAGGPDGPVWGKNGDDLADNPRRPIVIRLVRREGDYPAMVPAFAGMVCAGDGLNAAGLAFGSSSVGSVFQQSDFFPPVRLLAYEALLSSASTSAFVERMAGSPVRGKGFSWVAVDASGMAASLEGPCPLLQVGPKSGAGHALATNRYRLPHLVGADRRSEAQRKNALARAERLEAFLASEEPRGLADVRALLCEHGDPGICRHGKGAEYSVTEYSLIGLPERGELYYAEGRPCASDYETIRC